MPVSYTVTYVDHLDQGGVASQTTLARIYTVQANDGGVLYKLGTDDFEALQAAGVLPKKGAPAFGTFSTATVRQTLRFRRFQVSEKAGTLTVVASASTRYCFDPDYPTGGTPGGVWLPVLGAFVSGQMQVKVYRELSGATYPADPFSLPGTDIGSTSIDERGEPRDVLVPGGELVVTTTLDTYQVSKGVTWTDAQAFVGYLNSQPFLGWPKGTLLCTEYADPHIEDEYFESTLRFRYSPIYHLEQLADLDPNGGVKLDSDGRATSVKWGRGDSSSVDFNAIWGTPGALADFRKHRAEKGQYVYP